MRASPRRPCSPTRSRIRWPASAFRSSPAATTSRLGTEICFGADWRKESGLTRLLAIELLRHQRHLERFTEQWLPAAWTPMLSLFARLQREGKLRDDLDAAVLARQFMGINLSFLVTRLMPAPDLDWNDEAEIAAIAKVFWTGVGRRGGS